MRQNTPTKKMSNVQNEGAGGKETEKEQLETELEGKSKKESGLGRDMETSF